MKKWIVVLALLGCLLIPQLGRAGGGLSYYAQLEWLFKKDVRSLNVSFQHLYDSSIYFSFRSEIEESGEVVCSFENIPVGEYLLYVQALDGESCTLFSGQTELEVLPNQTTSAEVTLELSYSHRIGPDLRVDLGDQDKESVELQIWYRLPQRDEWSYAGKSEGFYVAEQRRVKMPYPPWIQFVAREVKITLPEYSVSAIWEVDWQNWQEVVFDFPTPEVSPVELTAQFLSETGRIWVVPIDFDTIQEAIDAAVAGDTVVVKAGTYWENLLLKPGVNIEGGIWRPRIEAYGTVISGHVGEAGLQTKLKGLTIVSSGGQDPIVSFDLGYEVFLEGCLIKGTEEQTLVKVVYSSCEMKNCTLAKGNIGLEIACSSRNVITKSVFLDLTISVSLYRGQFGYDDSVIFWNCQEYPDNSRIEDPKLTDWYYPLVDSPCRFEKIGALYIYYGGMG